MAALILPFMVLAAVGLVLSFIAHGCAWLGLPQPLGAATWALHFGIFVVGIPAMLASGRLVRGARREDVLRVALGGCPIWMRWTTAALFVYAFINFMVFFMMLAPAGDQPAGEPAPPAMLRGFSGHWMAFYAAALAALYSSWILSLRAEIQGIEEEAEGALQEGSRRNPGTSDRDPGE